MDKQTILDEIRRTAKANGGVPLGIDRFLAETGIRVADWHGKYWVRWGDAIREVGLTPNQMTGAYEDEELLLRLVSLIKELGHYPVKGDIRMKIRRDAEFPNDKTFRRLGTKGVIAAKIMDLYRGREGFEDVICVCEQTAEANARTTNSEPTDEITFGYVYLMKSGRNYKIGATNDIGRRGREIALELPDPANTIHVIKTDDPFGIEAYWHRRFAAKRKNSEWFELDRADVSAFRRRKTM